MEKEIKIKNFPNIRKIYISSGINEDSVLNFKKDLESLIATDEDVYVDNLRALGEIDKSLVKAYKDNVMFPDIVLDITSPGGSVYHGLAIYDIIQEVNAGKRHHIVAHLNGMVASAASFIMLACDKREATKNTSFLVHSISTFAGGKIEDLREEVEETERLGEIVKDIYVERTKLTKERIEEVDKLKKDWWINAEEAYKLGLITKII